MTTNTVKHTPPMTTTEKHRETAEKVVNDFRIIGDGCEGDLMEMIAAALANAEREGMRRAYEHCAEIAEDHAPGGERYEDYFHENDVAVRIAIRAAILSEANTNSPDTLPVEADSAGEAGSPPSSPASPAPYSPWTVKNGFNPDKVG